MEISTKNQEEISVCYFNAIAAKANTIVNRRNRDEDGIDVNVSKTIIIEDDIPFVAEVNFQIKSVYSKNFYGDVGGNKIYYDLKSKNYNDLVRESAIDRYLVLLILPEDNTQWVTENSDSLMIKKCMYYLSLRGNKPTNNKETVRVFFPTENVFDSSHLQALLEKSANGE